MRTAIASVGAALLLAGPVLAGPSLPVTKPPLFPVPSWTGPTFDPHAVAGQWFADAAGNVSVRTHEFYDNVQGFGGGLTGSAAIYGVVSALYFNPVGGLTGFDITARITNDDGPIGPWEEGINSHGEHVLPGIARQPYRGTLFDTKLTASFADDGVLGNFPGPAGPYLGSELSQNIYATNYDQLGWYCWTPENPQPDLAPWGGFMVPTWDFGDIPLGASATRILSFGLYTPVGPADPLWGLLNEAYQTKFDMLLNRTTSLKISEYFDALMFDPGTPYPVPPRHSSDVSVFHNIPEPTSLALLGLGALALVRRR